MPRPVIHFIEIQPVSFKLQHPFITAAGQKTHTHNVQIRVRLSNGTVGVAEASSSIAMPGESQGAMEHGLRALVPELRGQAIDEVRNLSRLVWRLQALHPTAAAAMECALLDAYTRYRGQPLAAYFGAKLHAVETDFTLSVGLPANLRRAAAAAAAKGFRRLKIKLSGTDPALDLERVRAVHCGAPRAQLVADGNQGFRLSQAVAFAQGLEKAGLKLIFFEQPFPRHDIRSMRLFRKRSHVPLFADEAVLTAADAAKLFELGAADGVNIKVAKSGLQGAVDIVQIARRYNKGMSIGCMEESKLGLAASVHLACGLGVFDWVDLDSIFLLERSPLRGGFTTKGPILSVKGIKAGIGL